MPKLRSIPQFVLFSNVNRHLSTWLASLMFIILFASPFKVFAYNPAAAASYAETWWNSRNTVMYNYYDNNDCANFISQCLIAGGLSLSAGTNGTGAFVDNYGCIAGCDQLNINLTTYQNSTYSGHMTSGYPTSFALGDIVIFGNNSTDYWKHAAINVGNGTAALDAHTNDRHQVSVSFYYPGLSPKFQSGDFLSFQYFSLC